MRNRQLRWRHLGLSLMVLAACGSAEHADVLGIFPVTFRVSTEETPLAGTTIELDGEALGLTDEAGLLKAGIRSHEGEVLKLTIRCPANYALQDAPKSLLIRRVQGLTRADKDLGLVTRIRCAPNLKEQVVILRTKGAHTAGLPVYLAGNAVGHLSLDGVLHMLIKARPGEALTAMVDTQSRPRMRPPSPQLLFSVGAKPGKVFLEQEFSEDVIKKARKRRVKAPRPVRLR